MTSREASQLILGTDGPVVVVSARTAAYLLRYADLERFRREHRGEDSEVDQTLIAMTVVALHWRGTATGTKEAPQPELDRSSVWLSTQQAAGALAMTDSGIRKAIRENRLRATRVGKAWRINQEQLAHFRANREGQAT
jgi:excisionase family DNA binding protein